MKRILLTQGKFTIVDNEDFEYLNQWKWHFGGHRYACRGINHNQRIYMHREIIKAKTNELVDHINGNELDNRKENLRLCNHQQNTHNRRISKNNTSGYKGVFWHKYNKKWAAHIRLNGKRIYLGYFTSPQIAAIAYNQAATKYFKDFAKINII